MRSVCCSSAGAPCSSPSYLADRLAGELSIRLGWGVWALVALVAAIAITTHPDRRLAVIATWALIVIGCSALTRYGSAIHVPNALEAALILTAAGIYLITLGHLVSRAAGRAEASALGLGGRARRELTPARRS